MSSRGINNEREAYLLGKPLHVGNTRVLLIDDFFVEDRSRVRRRINPPVKFPGNPIVVGDKPWDTRCFMPSVLCDDEAGLYRMWYGAFDWFAYVHQFHENDWTPEHGYPYYMCYAESHDGIHFDKPELGLIDYRGWTGTNVGMVGREKCQAFRVIANHSSTGQPGRFMISYKDNLPGMHGALCLVYSDDGIDWRQDPANPVAWGLRDTNHNLVFDEDRERWLLFTRPTSYAGQKKFVERDQAWGFKSRTAVAIGDTPQTLGNPRNIIWPEEDQVERIDQCLVTRCGSHFLGFAMMMGDDDHTDTHLIFSRDGTHWKRMPGADAYLPRGRDGDFDHGEAQSPKGIVEVGDSYHLYYSGNTSYQSNHETVRSIGLATLHRDRFIAQAGGDEGGYLLTREFVVEGSELRVNTCVYGNKHFAQFAAEVVQLQGRPFAPPQAVPGYSYEDCDAQPRDLLDPHVTWQGRTLEPLKGKPVQIRFYLRNVGMYALQIRA